VAWAQGVREAGRTTVSVEHGEVVVAVACAVDSDRLHAQVLGLRLLRDLLPHLGPGLERGITEALQDDGAPGRGQVRERRVLAVAQSS
jgi:hypothetical protein